MVKNKDFTMVFKKRGGGAGDPRAHTKGRICWFG